MDQQNRAWTHIALDRHFIVALLLGPLVWLGLSFWLAPAGRATSVQTIAMVVVIYPALEELAFRGFLQGWLMDKRSFKRQLIRGITLANLLTSALFAASHTVNQAPLWAAMVLPPSLVFGYFRDRYQLVWPSIILHAWYNAGFVYFFY